MTDTEFYHNHLRNSAQAVTAFMKVYEREYQRNYTIAVRALEDAKEDIETLLWLHENPGNITAIEAYNTLVRGESA